MINGYTFHLASPLMCGAENERDKLKERGI